jgi:8-oxo-dGTP pyrophosphatase MutT (NUDIX family)
MPKRAKKSAKAKTGKYKQFAALPWCLNEQGEVEILILTSRDSRQWILSKGRAEHPLTGADIAALEAEEEAGVKGVVAAEPVGGFWYDKHMKSGETLRCFVEVYPLRVMEQLVEWKEKGQRAIELIAPEIAVERLLANTNIPEKRRNKEKLARLVMRTVRKIYRDELGREPPALAVPHRPSNKTERRKDLAPAPRAPA